MNSFKPQVGDRVRVTVEATVTHVSHDDYFSADGWDFGLDDEGIKIERIADAVPTTPGSVMRDATGFYLLGQRGRWVDDNGDDCGTTLDTDLAADESPLVLVFDAGKVTA